MIIGIGIDMVEISRVKRAIENEKFIARVYTEKEINYCVSRGKGAVQSYAARFAAKEAILKALGTGLRGGKLTELEILPDDLGAPVATLTGSFNKLAQKKQIKKIWITLSHTKEYAAAQCIMEG